MGTALRRGAVSRSSGPERVGGNKRGSEVEFRAGSACAPAFLSSAAVRARHWLNTRKLGETVANTSPGDVRPATPFLQGRARVVDLLVVGQSSRDGLLAGSPEVKTQGAPNAAHRKAGESDGGHRLSLLTVQCVGAQPLLGAKNRSALDQQNVIIRRLRHQLANGQPMSVGQVRQDQRRGRSRRIVE